MKFVNIKNTLIDLDEVASINANGSLLEFCGVHSAGVGGAVRLATIGCSSMTEALAYIEKIEKILGNGFLGKL